MVTSHSSSQGTSSLLLPPASSSQEAKQSNLCFAPTSLFVAPAVINLVPKFQCKDVPRVAQRTEIRQQCS